jgi:hypothetical protein
MNKKVSKFLEFNGKTLVFLSKDSQYWIALKPICDALNIDYVQQFKNAQNSPIYGELLCNGFYLHNLQAVSLKRHIF